MERLERLFQCERPILWIWLSVIAMHLCLIGYCYLQSAVTPARPVRKSVMVQSVTLKPKSAKAAKPVSAAAAPAVKPTPAKKEAAPTPAAKKEKIAKPAAPTKTAPTKSAPIAKAKPAETATAAKKPKINAEALAQVKANLQKIDHQATAAAPAVTAAVAVTSDVSAPRPYEDLLAERLHLLLTLPDYGDVTIRLKLSRMGKVLNVSIVKSASEENRQYVQKTVPNLSLPPFGRSFGSDADHTFQLVLSN